MLDTIRQYFKQHRWQYWAVQILLIAVIYFVIHSWKTRELAQGEAPVLQGRLLNGQQISLGVLRGQPVLVHFWASWCPMCKMEQTSIDALAKDYQVLSIAAWSGNAGEMQQYMTAEKLNMPVVVDEHGDIARQWGVGAVPSSFFIDADGRISFVEQGYTTEYGFRLRLWWLKNF